MTALKHMLWKEYRYLGKIVLFIIFLGCIFQVLASFEAYDRSSIQSVYAVAQVLTICASFLLGTVMFAGETEARTNQLLLRLGIDPKTLLSGKILFSLMAIVVVFLSLLLTGSILGLLVNATLNFSSGSMFLPLENGQQIVVTTMLGTFALAAECLLLAMLVSCVVPSVLITLLVSVGLFLTGSILFAQISRDTYMLCGIHIVYSLLITSALAVLLPRWCTGQKVLSLPQRATKQREAKVTKRFLNSSASMRYFTRVFWLEWRNGWAWWVSVGILAVLFDLFIWYSFRWAHASGLRFGNRQILLSISLYLVPLALGFASCQGERAEANGLFWIHRGNSPAKYWFTKNGIWLAVTLALFAMLYLPVAAIAKSQGSVNLMDANIAIASNGFVPALHDFSLNPLIYALMLFALGQSVAILFASSVVAIFLVFCLSVLWIPIVHLLVAARIPFWIGLAPIVVGMLLVSYLRFTGFLLNDHRRLNRRGIGFVMPGFFMVAFVLSCGYRVYSAGNARSPFNFEAAEKMWYAGDREYTKQLIPLLNQLPSNRDVYYATLGERTEVKRKAESPQEESDALKRVHQRFWKNYLIEHEAELQKMRQLLSRQRSANPPALELMQAFRRWEAKPYEQWSGNDQWSATDQVLVYTFNCFRDHPKLLGSTEGTSREEILLQNMEAGLATRSIAYGFPYSSEIGYANGILYTAWPISMVKEDVPYLQRLSSEEWQQLQLLVQKQYELAPSLKELIRYQYGLIHHELELDTRYWRMFFWYSMDDRIETEDQDRFEFLTELAVKSRPTVLPTERMRAHRLLSRAAQVEDLWARKFDHCIEQQESLGLLYESYTQFMEQQLPEQDYYREIRATPALHGVLENRLLREAATWQMQVREQLLRLATIRFRLDNGNYPDQLKDLVPNYLAELPHDPWTGSDYQYIGPNFEGLIIDREGNRVTQPIIWSRNNADYDLVTVTNEEGNEQTMFRSRRGHRSSTWVQGRKDKTRKPTYSELPDGHYGYVILPE